MGYQVPDAADRGLPSSLPNKKSEKDFQAAVNSASTGKKKPADAGNNPGNAAAPGYAGAQTQKQSIKQVNNGNNPGNPNAQGYAGGSAPKQQANQTNTGNNPGNPIAPGYTSGNAQIAASPAQSSSQIVTTTTNTTGVQSSAAATPVAQSPLQTPVTFSTTVTVTVPAPTATTSTSATTQVTAPVQVSVPVTVTVTPGSFITATQTPTGSVVMTTTPTATVTVTPTQAVTNPAVQQALTQLQPGTEAWNEVVKHDIAPKLKLVEWGLNGAFVFLDQGLATVETAGSALVGTSVTARTGQFAANSARKALTFVTAVANGDYLVAAGNMVDMTRIWRSGPAQMDRLIPLLPDEQLLDGGKPNWFASKIGATDIWSAADKWKIPLFNNPAGAAIAGWVNAANQSQIYAWAKANGGKLVNIAGISNIVFEGALAGGNILQAITDAMMGRNGATAYTATKKTFSSLNDFVLDVGPAQFWFSQLTNDGAYYFGTGMEYARSNSVRHVEEGVFQTGEAIGALWSITAGGPNPSTNGDWFDARINLANGLSNDGQYAVLWGQAITKDWRLILTNGVWAYADGAATAEYNQNRLDANGVPIKASDWKPMTMIGFLADQMSTWGVGTASTAAGIDYRANEQIAKLNTAWVDYQQNGQNWWRYYGAGVDILDYSMDESRKVLAYEAVIKGPNDQSSLYIWGGMSAQEQAVGVVPDRIHTDRVNELKMQAEIQKLYLEDLNAWRALPLTQPDTFSTLPSSYIDQQGDKAIQQLESLFPVATASGIRDAQLFDVKVHYARLYSESVTAEGGNGQAALDQKLAEFGITREQMQTYEAQLLTLSYPAGNSGMIN